MKWLQAGCIGVQRLVRSCPASALEAYDEQLLTGLLGVLSHQHSRVRMTALVALNALVLKVTAPPKPTDLAPCICITTPRQHCRALALSIAYASCCEARVTCGMSRKGQG